MITSIASSIYLAGQLDMRHNHLLRLIDLMVERRNLVLDPTMRSSFSVKDQKVDGGNGRGVEYIMSPEAVQLVLMSCPGDVAMKNRKAVIVELQQMR